MTRADYRMRRAGLYLNGERFEVASLIVRMGGVELIGKVFVPPRCKFLKFLNHSAQVRVRYGGLSGWFYFAAAVSVPIKKSLPPWIEFTAVAAGPVKVKP